MKAQIFRKGVLSSWPLVWWGGKEVGKQHFHSTSYQKYPVSSHSTQTHTSQQLRKSFPTAGPISKSYRPRGRLNSQWDLYSTIKFLRPETSVYPFLVPHCTPLKHPLCYLLVLKMLQDLKHASYNDCKQYYKNKQYQFAKNVLFSFLFIGLNREQLNEFA